MARQFVESDFGVTVLVDSVVVDFWPSNSRYVFPRFLKDRDVAEFGLLSPSPTVRHASRAGGTGNFDAADVMAMAFRLATRAISQSAPAAEQMMRKSD
jgi:hypothetical protein